MFTLWNGKESNSAKSSVMADFLKFVDANSQPNGRSADSHGPTHYISKFSTIQIPKSDVPNYGERVRRSVVGEFCKAQSEASLVALMDQLPIGFTPTDQKLLSALISRITAIRVPN